MVIPTTAYAVGVLLVLVLPGVVYAAVRTAVHGLRPYDRDLGSRILQAIFVSALLDTVYLLLLGDVAVRVVTVNERGVPVNPRFSAFVGLLLGVAVPGLLAYFVHGRPRWRRLKIPRLRWVRLPLVRTGYDPTPTAWDKAAPNLGGCWVRIRIGQGKWVGGWYGDQSFISTYPEPRDIYIQAQYYVGKDGAFGERVRDTAGVWLALREGDIVEWLEPEPE